MMKNILIISEGLLISVLIGYIVTTIKYKTNKIEIMNIRNRANKLDKINKKYKDINNNKLF